MTSASRRNLIAVALPIFLLFVLIAVIRFVSTGLPVPRSSAIAASLNRQRPLPADPATQQAIAVSITGQINAVRRGEYERALSFSTEPFRASMSPQRFREVIEKDFSALTGSTGQKIGPALIQASSAAVEVIVTGPRQNDRNKFGFTLVQEAGSWKILSCTPLQFPRRSEGNLKP